MNFSKLSFIAQKESLVRAKQNIVGSLEALTDKTSDYAEHHQHIINVYSEVIERFEFAISDSEDIGEGV